MKKALFTFVMLATSISFASTEGTSKVENPTYRCEKQGGGMAIALDGQSARIWMTELNSDEGAELTDVKIEARMRCPHCFDFSGKISLLGETAELKLQLRNTSGLGAKLTATGDGQVILDEVPCRIMSSEKK